MVHRAADVQLELPSAVESPEHRQVQQTAITPGERLAAPPRTAAVLRYEPLEVAREVVRLGQSGIRVLGAQDFSADLESLLEHLVYHRHLLSLERG